MRYYELSSSFGMRRVFVTLGYAQRWARWWLKEHNFHSETEWKRVGTRSTLCAGEVTFWIERKFGFHK